jgi:hypothetical protein
MLRVSLWWRNIMTMKGGRAGGKLWDLSFLLETRSLIIVLQEWRWVSVSGGGVLVLVGVGREEC